MCVCSCVYVCVGAHGSQKRTLELELQGVICLIWVLGTEFRSSERALCALNH